MNFCTLVCRQIKLQKFEVILLGSCFLCQLLLAPSVFVVVVTSHLSALEYLLRSVFPVCFSPEQQC